jgi:Zn-dependent protease
VWRWEKLTLLPNCFPLPVISHLRITLSFRSRAYFICFYTFSQPLVLTESPTLRQIQPQEAVRVLGEQPWCYTVCMLSGVTISQLGIFIAILLVSLSVHEATHAYVAHKLGDSTAAEEGRLTLNPLKHVDLYMTVLLPVVMVLLHLSPILIAKPVPLNPERVRFEEFGSALVALAGPFSNLALAGLAALCYNIGLISAGLTDILTLFISMNILLFAFNMLPIPPLDGSRLLYAFAPEPVQRVMYQFESLGFLPFIVLILAFGSFLSPILLHVNQTILNFLI